MAFSRTLTKASYDGVTSALTGNGSICTTLGPTGYHTADLGEPDAAHRTQCFVWSGRRLSGPQHPLLNLGTLSRDLYVGGADAWAEDWSQRIDWQGGAVVSDMAHPGLLERTRSCVTLHSNTFIARSTVTNTGSAARDVVLDLRYEFGEDQAHLSISESGGAIRIGYSIEEHLGDIHFRARIVEGPGVTMLRADTHGAHAEARSTLEPGGAFTVEAIVRFSDRADYQFPPSCGCGPELLADHAAAWGEFWGRSGIVTGDADVDDFLRSALYTIRCQATPWSVPPTLSQPYWGGGAFHDEMYPFLALLATNHGELAANMPYFRLTTLPRAIERARGRGALYPWCSTERGEERDPNGLWLTERFHLGQFAVCAWALWQHEPDPMVLEDLYPVLRQVARYFEANVVERGEDGRLRTRRCVDFDESVGQVTNGPFTISAAIWSLERAAAAAEALGRDSLRIPRWRAMAAELRGNLPSGGSGGDETFGIPDGKPLHYSVLGPIYPFRVEVGSPRARRTAERIHAELRSELGWKPGFSDAFTGSDWMWMAGHLAAVHALHGDAARAWEAIRGGAASAGPLLSPNEHIDRHREPKVPWFTTGVGAWVHGLCSLCVTVDDDGAILLPAAPEECPDLSFTNLRADGGVRVSGRFAQGRLVELTASALSPTTWSCRIPTAIASAVRLAGTAEPLDGGLTLVRDVAIGQEPASLLLDA